MFSYDVDTGSVFVKFETSMQCGVLAVFPQATVACPPRKQWSAVLTQLPPRCLACIRMGELACAVVATGTLVMSTLFPNVVTIPDTYL